MHVLYKKHSLGGGGRKWPRGKIEGAQKHGRWYSIMNKIICLFCFVKKMFFAIFTCFIFSEYRQGWEGAGAGSIFAQRQTYTSHVSDNILHVY